MRKWILVLQRRTKQRITKKFLDEQLGVIKKAAEANQKSGFCCEIDSSIPPTEERRDSGRIYWRYKLPLTLTKPVVTSTVMTQQQYERVFRKLKRTAQSREWKLLDHYTTVAVSSPHRDGWSNSDERPQFILPDLDEEAQKTYFSHIFERDPHIQVIHHSVASYYQTDKARRSHVLLYGLPAGAKTTVFGALKRFYEQDGVERVAMLDATTLTKAGLENWILERSQHGCLPEILCLEEIEKHQPNNLLSLLSIMASGEMMRTNSRIGRVIAQAKVLVWATCNDEGKLKAFHNEALWSRFSHKLPCARPTRSLMEKILQHEVAKLPNGDLAWVDPVLRYSYDEVGDDDPRSIVGLLDGCNKIMDGTYFAYLREIRKAKQEEKARRGELEQKSLDLAIAQVRAAFGRDRAGILRLLGLDD